MENTVQSVLCDKIWRKDADPGCNISFRADGTGDLLCARELNVFIGAEFDWKLQQGSPSLDRAINADEDCSAELHIELTLTKRRSADARNRPDAGSYLVNEDFISDGGFLPKSYTIQLEKGKFQVACGYTWSYGLRLLFDKSPFPPPELWKARRAAAELNAFHERVDFYADMLDITDPDGRSVK